MIVLRSKLPLRRKAALGAIWHEGDIVTEDLT